MEQLLGGFVSAVERHGKEVHRHLNPRWEYVHPLLRFLTERGWRGAPVSLRAERDIEVSH